MEYNLFADALNKFSQVTPVIQAVIVVGFCGTMLGWAYFLKECIASIMRPLCRTKVTEPATAGTEEKREWRDKYYRG